MQPSQFEIQREVEALRDIRRRSTSQGGPGALIIDPDLPISASSTSPPSPSYWSPSSSPALTDASSSGSSNPDDPSSSEGPPNANSADDPFHLFWVPAGLHPEIAPAEFRAFLKEHARTPPAGDGTFHTTPERPSSLATSSSLGRKKSMLSRQYRPSDTDGEEDDEKILPLRRNRSVFNNQNPQLTINDLQKLEELAEEASESDDPSKLRTILRRSLSLNMPPSVVDKMGDAPDMADEANLPIIVPPPGQILRRAARTKIRKPSLAGDGGGHRFPASRRGTRGGGGTTPTSPELAQQRLSSETFPSDLQHGDMGQKRESVGSDGPSKRDTFSEESSIFDAYVRDEEEEEEEEVQTPTVVMSPPPITVELPVQPPPPEEEIPLAAPAVLYQPQPQRLSIPEHSPDRRPSSRTPSPDYGAQISSMEPYVPQSPPQQDPSQFFPTSPIQQRKEKDKKGLFGKWVGDKDKKKSGKEKERENRERVEKEREKEKEKESGFFGSLFGGKKKQDESMPGALTSGAGREAAAALLGASKSSKSSVLPASPTFAGVAGSYARYPIHVERAIYRLSHIKLANPRRPLYEQVLISNLMFWYLGVINKTQNPSPPPSTPGAVPTAATASQAEREQQEREAREKAEKEEQEQEIERERSEKDRVVIEQKKEGRRGSLTRPPSTGKRVAEMPVRGPQYEMQHRVMEQEYGGFSGQPSSPVQAMGPQHRMQPPGTPKMKQTQLPGQAPLIQNSYYYPTGGGGGSQSGYTDTLPPGAMSPANVEQQQTWLSKSPPSSSPRPRQRSSPSPPPITPGNSPPASGGYSNPRRSRSPPPPNQARLANQYSSTQPDKSPTVGRLPGRSLSATAAPPLAPQMNGRLKKGSASVHAVPTSSNGRRPRTSDGAEEDVPLAVWQQQRRR